MIAKTVENALHNAKRKKNGVSKWVIDEGGKEIFVIGYKDGRVEVIG